MPKPTKFRLGPWTLVADPPPCDPSNPGRAFAYCERSRRGERCSCEFDLALIGEDLEELGLAEYSDQLDDELGPEALSVLLSTLASAIGQRNGASAVRLREELALLQRLVEHGSGVRPGDDV